MDEIPRVYVSLVVAAASAEYPIEAIIYPTNHNHCHYPLRGRDYCLSKYCNAQSDNLIINRIMSVSRNGALLAQ